jgi:hypothetical protein
MAEKTLREGLTADYADFTDSETSYRTVDV